MCCLCKIFAIICGVFLLNACQLLPENRIQSQLIAIPSVDNTLQVDVQAEKIIQEWPKENWWLEFHNAELDRLINLVLQDNPGLHIAIARLKQAEAGTEFQYASLLPTLNSNLELHHRRFSGTDFFGANGGKTFTGAYLDAGVFRYHLDFWGKDKANLEAAIGKLKAEASELAMARLLLTTAVVRNYIQLCSTEEEISITQQLAENAQTLLSLTDIRWQHGLISQDAIHAEQQRLIMVKQRLSTTRSAAQKLRNHLASLAGQGADWGASIRISTNEIAQVNLPLPESIALGLLVHRPDLAAAKWQVESAAELIKVAKANFYPDVNLVGFAGLRSLKLNELFLSHGASLAYSMGPTISLPIFEGGRLEAELKNQNAAYSIAVERYNETLLNAIQQVADSLADWRASLEDDTSQQIALQTAEAQNVLADKRFNAGLSSRDPEIESMLTLIKQRSTFNTLHTVHLLAAVSLFEALGGGYQNEAYR